MDMRIYRRAHIRIYSYSNTYLCGHAVIRIDNYTDSRMHVYTADPIYGYINRPSPNPCAKKAPRRTFSPFGVITPLFCFVMCKLCFCTYGARTSAAPTKTNLPGNHPVPTGKGGIRGGKRSQLPFSPAKRTITAAGRRTSINL